MAHDSHHSSHEVGGHEEHNDQTARPHAGYYEVPIALGISFWALVLVIIYCFNLNCARPGCCEEDGECKPQTEQHDAGHH